MTELKNNLIEILEDSSFAPYTFEELLSIKNGQTTSDGKFTITSLRCVGACALAPVVQINGKTYGNVKIEEVAKILAEYK